MNKRERLKRLLHDFTETDDVLVESFKSFDSEIARLKSQLKEKVNIRTLNNVNDELNKFREKLDLPAIINEFNRLRDDINDHVRQALYKCEQMLSEFEKSAEDIAESVSDSKEVTKRKIDDLGNELRQVKIRVSSLQDDILADLSKKMKEIKMEMDAKLSDDGIDTEQIKDFTSKFENEVSSLRSEFLEKLSAVQSGLSSSGGGAMNRQLKVGGTDVLKTYTDINFIAGTGITITTANNNTNKNVGITISSSGGSGFQQPLTGAVNGSNTVYTWTTAPNALMVDRVPMQKVSSDGTVNWTGTTTTTLNVIPFNDLFAVA